MGKQFDELAKALAAGTSRRSALKRFAAGLAGTALASTFLGRSAQAQSGEFEADQTNECHEVCRDAEFFGRDFGQCVAECATCLGQGGQAFLINSGNLICS